MLRKGLISTIMSRNVCYTGSGGGIFSKKTKALEVFLKIVYDYPSAYFLIVPPLSLGEEAVQNSVLQRILLEKETHQHKTFLIFQLIFMYIMCVHSIHL